GIEANGAAPRGYMLRFSLSAERATVSPGAAGGSPPPSRETKTRMFKTWRTADHEEYPRLVAVETTSRCNAECPFCPYNVRSREKTHMDQALFEKIIQDCTEFPLPAIEPFLNGEPFVDPKIMDRLEMIRSRLPNTKLRVYSNGYALSP